MNKYTYNGPVMIFDKCVTSNWKGETMAPTKKKARSNLVYQAKQQLGKIPGTMVTLPGEIKTVS